MSSTGENRSRDALRYKKAKYSLVVANFTRVLNVEPTRQAVSVLIVPSLAMMGTRKVKNLLIDFVVDFVDSEQHLNRYSTWFLIYCPNGSEIKYHMGFVDQEDRSHGIAEEIVDGCSNVIAFGHFRDSTTPVRVFSPLARNMRSGDMIRLILVSMDPAVLCVALVSVSYSVSFA
jgi:hypothetical protein